jgi:hypothetical protein
MESVDVRLKDQDNIVWVPPRRLSQKEEQLVDEEVEELLKMGSINSLDYLVQYSHCDF